MMMTTLFAWTRDAVERLRCAETLLQSACSSGRLVAGPIATTLSRGIRKAINRLAKPAELATDTLAAIATELSRAHDLACAFRFRGTFGDEQTPQDLRAIAEELAALSVEARLVATYVLRIQGAA